MSLDKLASLAIKHVVDGKEYTISPIGPSDIAAYETYLREKLYKLHWSASKEMDKATAIEVGNRILFGEIDSKAADSLFSTEGMLFIVWRSLRKTDPSLRLEDIDLSHAALIELIRAINSLSSGGGTDKAPLT